MKKGLVCQEKLRSKILDALPMNIMSQYRDVVFLRVYKLFMREQLFRFEIKPFH